MPVDVSTLRILTYPDPCLRARAAPIREIDDHVRSVAERMIALMYEAEGIGLAAPQVGVSWRLFVADVPPGDDRRPDADPPTALEGPQVYINPAIIEPAPSLEMMEEGCLSLPGIHGDVNRPPEVSIEYTSLEGDRRVQRGAGLLARCWQHELDHLDGVLILDRMTQPSRLKARAAVRRMEKDARR
jgi:peptide deformylase